MGYGLSFSANKATGRAECKLCGCKINKGLQEIVVTGWQCGGHIHRNESACKKATMLKTFEKAVRGV
jgi:hypothetical protein